MGSIPFAIREYSSLHGTGAGTEIENLLSHHLHIEVKS